MSNPCAIHKRAAGRERAMNRTFSTTWNLTLPILSAAAVLTALAVVRPLPARAQQPAQQAGQPQQKQSGGAASQPSRPKRVRADLSGFDLAPKKTSKNAQIGGGTRGALSKPVLYAPHRGKTYTTNPTFFWGDRGSETDFRLTVYDSDEKELCRTKVHGKSFTYPAGAPPLKPGETYSWTVRAASGLMAEPADPVEFVVLSGAERKSAENTLHGINGDSDDARLRRAEVFVDARLWYDAVEAYSVLIAKNPSDAMLYRARAAVYDQLIATQPLADQDYAHFEQLVGPK